MKNSSFRNFLLIITAALLFTPHFSLAAIISGDIAGSVTWTPAEGPYVVNYAHIPTGSTLTILPGTIVKAYDNGHAFTVDGTLTVGQAGGAPVTITSLHDDATGGDTNGDGGATTPRAGDWRSIVVNAGGTATFINAIVRYGGQTFYSNGGYIVFHTFQNNGGILTLDHATIAQSGNNAILQTAGTTTLANSLIDNAFNGLSAQSGAVTLTHNTFTNLTYYAAVISGATQLTNNAGNSGTAGIYMSDIARTSTLPADTIPYLLSSLTIPANTTLTILPGAAVKILFNSQLFVDGTLTVGQTGGAPVSITSYKDDTTLGDANHDGSATAPSAGDWYGIVLHPGAQVNMTNTIVRYAGANSYSFGNPTPHPLIQNNGGTLTLASSTLTDSYNDAITQLAGTTTCIGTFIDNANYGLRVSGGALEIGDNTFTHIGGYTVSVTGTTGFVNHGNNHGEGGLFIDAVASGANHWGKDTMPYVTGGFLIPADSSLAIDPGTVIKILANAIGFFVDGTLTVGGTGEQTFITSIADDSVGGDTNRDGTSTTPHAGDWRSIIFHAGAEGNLMNTTIRYGAAVFYSGGNSYWAPALQNDGGTLTLDHVTLTDHTTYALRQTSGTTTVADSTIAHNDTYGIVIAGGTASVHHSALFGNSVYALYNSSGNIIDATQNWWGSATGPTHASNPQGTGDKVSDSVNFGNWLGADPMVAAPACTHDCYSNVLFLPGIEASRLYEKDSFGFEHRRWEPTENLDTKNLFLDQTGKLPGEFANPFAQIYTRDVVDEAYPEKFGAAASNIYKSFLLQLADWKETQHLIADYSAVPYDWRLSLEDILNNGTKTGANISYAAPSADPYIISELRRLVVSSKTEKVTIIAHSNGGLVAKALIKKLEDTHDPLLEKIDKIIFVAVPQTGTPQAIGALLHGYKQGIPATAPFYLSSETARAMAKNLPGAYNLFPSEQYFRDVATPVVKFPSTSLFVAEQARYGNTIDNASELDGFLRNTENALTRTNVSISDTKTPPSLNPLLLDAATATHSFLDNLPVPSTIQVFEIAGWGVETLAGIEYKQNSHFFSSPTWDYDPTIVEDGDGTVVTPSALAMSVGGNVGRYWVNLQAYNDNHRVQTVLGLLSLGHADILEVTELRTFLKDVIINQIDPLSAYQYLSTSKPQSTSQKKLRYILHSPLSLELYDNQGHHVGIATSTGAIDNQIPGAYYREFGEVKYISAPASTTLHLVLNGQASGVFSLDIQEVQGDTIIATTTFADIPSSTSTIVTLDTPASGGIASSSALRVDENGDGITDFSIAPKLNGTVTLPPPDITPPVTIATTTGISGKNGWYASNILVTLSATDTQSGIASTTYSLNNGIVWTPYTTPFTITNEGTTTILYRSTDRAGNREATNTLNIKIDKTAPEAQISVSTSTQDIFVEGTDNLTATIITKDASSTYSIVDQAGHTTKLFFTKTYAGKYLTFAKLTALQYDSAVKTNIAASSFLYLWDTKVTPPTLVSQTIAVNDTFLIQALYDKSKNKTTVIVLKKNVPYQTLTFSGFKVVKLTTSKGIIGYSL